MSDTGANLSDIKDVHIPGVQGNFREIIEARIIKLRSTKSADNHDSARFFEYLLSEVDADEYSLIQRHYLSAPDGMTKYLDPIVWFESKLRVARKLGLNNKGPLKILDLGTGPGHFPVVARYYGHDVTGTDLPRVSGGVDKTGHFYDALCSIYRVKRISHVIKPNEPLGGLNRDYAMVTTFLAAFNVDERKMPWSVENWRFFLTDINLNVLARNGVLFMMLDDKKLTGEVWQYLVSLAEWSEPRSKQVYISNFAPL